jgi:hypothetical protein
MGLAVLANGRKITSSLLEAKSQRDCFRSSIAQGVDGQAATVSLGNSLRATNQN